MRGDDSRSRKASFGKRGKESKRIANALQNFRLIAPEFAL